jgi:hypothetical protein
VSRHPNLAVQDGEPCPGGIRNLQQAAVTPSCRRVAPASTGIARRAQVRAPRAYSAKKRMRDLDQPVRTSSCVSHAAYRLLNVLAFEVG